MKKLLSPLSLAILALALIFSSVAYAKKGGNNPGDDNPGSTTQSLGFIAFGLLPASASCFSSDSWCNDYFADISYGTATSGDPEAYAYASAEAYLGCEASAGAGASFESVFVANGQLDLTRHGLNGSMHHIEMFAGFTQAGALSIGAGAHADAWARGSSYVYGSYSNFEWPVYCAFADYFSDPNFDPIIQDLCLWVDEYAYADGSGWAMASSHGQGWADAYSESTSGVGTWTGVWAANIERFQSVVAAGASNFSFATAGANASAMVDTYANAYMTAYEYACATLDDLVQGGFWAVCSSGYSSAYASAYAFAYDWIGAYADAFAATSVGMQLPATYVNENGTVDTIIFGDALETWQEGLIEVSCSAGN